MSAAGLLGALEPSDRLWGGAVTLLRSAGRLEGPGATVQCSTHRRQPRLVALACCIAGLTLAACSAASPAAAPPHPAGTVAPAAQPPRAARTARPPGVPGPGGSPAIAGSTPSPAQRPAAGQLSPTAGSSHEPGSAGVPAPTATALPARMALPGAAAALPAVPAGVPFVGHLLIADRGNRRIVEITPSGRVSWLFPKPGQVLPVPFGYPDDAFYTHDFQAVVANSEANQTVTAIAVHSRSILWQAGVPGRPGRGKRHFNWPDDAVPAADGTITVADIRNCRLVHLSAAGQWLGALGTGACRHQPPVSFAAPNGAFPTQDGGLVVTEISGSWVDWLKPDGSLAWAVRAPVRYPSDAVPYPDGSVLLTDYSLPGQVIRMAPNGHVLWRFAPTGRYRLNHPSIALPLASNRVAICDDNANRVLIVDPTTNAVVWQYWGQGGTHLNDPDGLDFRPT
ncbi:MAG: outer membrane protein assembly factor BamB family protein [Chloroflexota bacterium]